MAFFEEWVGGAEETITIETYGYSLQDTEKYLADVRVRHCTRAGNSLVGMLCTNVLAEFEILLQQK